MEPLENKIHKLEDVVRPILETNIVSRGDDFELVLRVYESLLGYSDYIDEMSFRELMHNHIALDLPPFESITRCRRKLQQEYPELRPSEDIQLIRANETATYIEYALDI